MTDSKNWVDSVMATLSEEEKIAQLFMVAAYSNKGQDHIQHIVNLVEPNSSAKSSILIPLINS